MSNTRFIAKAVIERVIGDVLGRIAKSPVTSLEPKDVPSTAAQVAQEVAIEVESRVRHVTNTEPAYKSRVTIGSTVAIVAAVIGIAHLFTSGNSDWESYSPHVGVLFGAAFALYGRWVSTKPLGE